MGAGGFGREAGVGAVGVQDCGDDGVEVGGWIAQDVDGGFCECPREELEMELSGVAEELEESHGELGEFMG